MYITLQTKILVTVLTIVLLFTFFTLFYFPAQQRRLLFSSYNKEVQSLSNTVALGVRISLNEQNYEGVKTAMGFVNGHPSLRFVSLVQSDTVWNSIHTAYQVRRRILAANPESAKFSPDITSADSLIVKRTPFHTSVMSGDIILGFSTDAIVKSQQQIFRTSLLISGAIFLIGLLIGFWTSHNLSAPVIALHNAARRIAKGDLTPMVTKFSNDEIGDLSKAFNTMVKELSGSREELHAANRELSKTNTTLSTTLENLRATQQQLVQSEKMASLGELTAGIAHEIQNPLNFVNNFAEVNKDLLEEIKEMLSNGSSKNVLSSINTLRENEEKILHHGRRADNIVKNMLQHSRKGTGKKEPVEINLLVDEYLRLSYHGLRAKDKAFNVKLVTDYDDSIGKIAIEPQDIGRVLLNLYNNAFYSVNEQHKLRIESFEPTVIVKTKKLANKVEIVVKDNGIGISQKVQEKIFQPFFTTKPTGEGTGLGLSLSYDIITKGHSGELKVESKEGEGAAFVVQLPLQ